MPRESGRTVFRAGRTPERYRTYREPIFVVTVVWVPVVPASATRASTVRARGTSPYPQAVPVPCTSVTLGGRTGRPIAFGTGALRRCRVALTGSSDAPRSQRWNAGI